MSVVKNLWVTINLYKTCLPIRTWNQKHSLKQTILVSHTHTHTYTHARTHTHTIGEKFFVAATFKGL